MKLYVIGSLKNDAVPRLATQLREDFQGLTVFDDWYAAGPEADDYWQAYEKRKGITYAEALKGEAATHVFLFDRFHLLSSDMAVLVTPAGKSAHLELGYFLGKDRPGAIFMPEGEPERWDVMYKFADGVFTSYAALAMWVKNGVEK